MWDLSNRGTGVELEIYHRRLLAKRGHRPGAEEEDGAGTFVCHGRAPIVRRRMTLLGNPLLTQHNVVRVAFQWPNATYPPLGSRFIAEVAAITLQTTMQKKKTGLLGPA